MSGVNLGSVTAALLNLGPDYNYFSEIRDHVIHEDESLDCFNHCFGDRNYFNLFLLHMNMGCFSANMNCFSATMYCLLLTFCFSPRRSQNRVTMTAVISNDFASFNPIRNLSNQSQNVYISHLNWYFFQIFLNMHNVHNALKHD